METNIGYNKDSNKFECDIKRNLMPSQKPKEFLPSGVTIGHNKNSNKFECDIKRNLVPSHKPKELLPLGIIKVDPTLTKSGWAADAKVVGDIIDGIQKYAESVIVLNLYDDQESNYTYKQLSELWNKRKYILVIYNNETYGLYNIPLNSNNSFWFSKVDVSSTKSTQTIIEFKEDSSFEVSIYELDISTKQDILTAGDGIKINNNIISIDIDGTYATIAYVNEVADQKQNVMGTISNHTIDQIIYGVF